MDESYGTFVDDEYFHNHDYDDTDDFNDHKEDSYTVAGAAPDAGAAPTQTSPGHARPVQARPDQARPQKYVMLTLFWHEWASDRRWEVFDTIIRKHFSSSIDLDESWGRFICSKGGS